eukprot:gene19298-23644_t
MLNEIGAADVEESSTFPAIALNPTFHEIGVSNQLLYVSPSLEATKRYWINEYHDYISVICTLPRISALRFQVFAETSADRQDYGNIIDMVGMDILKGPYLIIEKRYQEAKEQVQKWLQYQALWDASPIQVTESLGSSVELWCKFLQDIKKARSSLDVEKDERCFGPFVINHVQ